MTYFMAFSEAQGRGTPSPWDIVQNPRRSEYLTPGLLCKK
jgi:hypothetical protein